MCSMEFTSKRKKQKLCSMNCSINYQRTDENKEKATLIFKAISELAHNQRVAFTLIRVQGMKHEEVSEIMQLSIKAVESLLSRAKENLKNKLKHYYNL